MAGSIQLLWYVFVLSSWCLTIFCLETKDYIYAAYPTTLIADTDFPITFGATFNTSEQDILVTVTVSSANVSFSKNLTEEASKEQIILRVKDEFIKTASISLLASVDGFQVAKLSLGGSSKHISRSDGFSVLVQTDKGIYKAGQTVQFRIMGITNDRVVTVKPMTIEIFDSERNRLRRWQNVSDNSGVYIGRMEMSNYPVLGLWSIKVTVEEKSWSKTFEVNEFVLPKFEVLMNFPKVVSIREDEIVAGKVAARYTFGTAVIGTAVVKMKYSSRTLFQKEYQLENGEATVEVNMTALTSGMYSSSRAVSIEVTFEEELTSESILQTSSLTIYRYNAKLLLDSMLSTNHFLQGEDIKAELDVVNRDGTEYEGLASEKFVVNVEIDIEFKPGHEYVSLTKRTNITIDTKNHVTFVFENIYHNVSFFKFVYQMKTINATGAGLSTIYKYVRYYGSQSGHYIFIKRLTQPDTYKVGELAKFTIEATRPTPIDVQLQILSKGKIDSEETVALSNTETFNYTVVVTEDLVPKFNILAWYFDEKNVSFVADAIQTKVISVEKDEKVAIRFNKEIVKPGEDIAVEMISNPRSNLYVLAVDKSVLLLSKGNDITKAMLPKTVDPMANLIPRYGSTYNKDLYTAGLRLTYRALEFPTVSTPAATSTAIREESTSTTSVYIPGTSSSSSVEYVPTSAASSSVYASTSSQQQPRPRTTSRSQGAKYLSKTNVDDFDTGASPVKQETTRTLFPDTWLFDNVTSSEMGKATIKTIVPDTITTWVASCFSVSSSSFLSVATSPAQVTVFMPFFVSLQLPFSVIRGEQVVLQANVFNYHKDDIYVLVSLKDNWRFRSLASVKRGKNFSIEETCGRADHCIFTKAGKATPAFFPIVPNIIGEIQIEITADSSLFKDTVKKKLRVEAEGLQKSIAYPIMIDLTNSTAFDATVKYEFPPNTVDGSQRMRVDVAGDIMGPTIDGLESLVKMPYGCGEQNMISLSPSVFVSKYLKAINGLSSDLKKRAEGFITTECVSSNESYGQSSFAIEAEEQEVQDQAETQTVLEEVEGKVWSRGKKKPSGKWTSDASSGADPFSQTSVDVDVTTISDDEVEVSINEGKQPDKIISQQDITDYSIEHNTIDVAPTSDDEVLLSVDKSVGEGIAQHDDKDSMITSTLEDLETDEDLAVLSQELENLCFNKTHISMKELAGSLVKTLHLTNDGWTVAYTPENRIHLLLNWKNGYCLKEIILTQADGNIYKEIRINKLLIKCKGELGKNLIQDIVAMCTNLKNLITSCTGIVDKDIVQFCEEEEKKVQDQEKKEFVIFQELNEKSNIFTKTVRSAKCKSVCKNSAKKKISMCSSCYDLLRNRLSHRLNRSTQPRLSADKRLTKMTNSELLLKCKKQKNLLKDMKRKNNKLTEFYHKSSNKKNKIEPPSNFNISSNSLGKTITLSIENGWMKENSVLHNLLQDTVKGLEKKDSNRGLPSKGMRYSPLVIKWCCDLAEKCHKTGYEAVRKVLPLPHLKTVQSYKNFSTDCTPINENNLNRMVQEMERRKCNGVGGIHWDEVVVKKGIKVNSRTNELVGFEDLDIPSFLTDKAINEDVDNDEVDAYSSGESDCEDNDNSKKNSTKPMAKMILQFFWTSLSGDFSWPVASYPVDNLTCIKLTGCIWKTVKALSELKLTSELQRVHVLYGVCDGASYSSAFCNRAGSKNYVTDNPYHSGMPIYWLSDAPHMIKKMRNHILSSKRKLQWDDKYVSFSHFLDVAKRGMTKVTYKHVYIDNRAKMNVKKAAQLLSEEVANDLLHSPTHSPQDTSLTREYIHHCNQYFKIMNSTEIKQGDINKLLKTLCWFKRWKRDIKQETLHNTNLNEENWKKFMPITTFRDLKRSIRGFCGLYMFTTMHFPNINFVPKTTNQDDVENYFSLQRGRCCNELTVDSYFTNNAALSTANLLKAEMSDIGDQMGSYSTAHLPNFVSKPLKRRKSIRSDLGGDEVWQMDDEVVDLGMDTDIVIKQYSPSQIKLLEVHLNQIYNHLNIKAPRVIIHKTQNIIDSLQENKSVAMNFFIDIDTKLRTYYFNAAKWKEDSLKYCRNKLKRDNILREKWNTLLQAMGYNLIDINEKKESIHLLGLVMKKFSHRRCVHYLRIDELSPADTNQKSAIREMLKQYQKKDFPNKDDKCYRCGVTGHWAIECKQVPSEDWLKTQVCFKCNVKGHISKTCPNIEKKEPKKTLASLILQLESVEMHADKQYKGHETKASFEDNTDRYLKQGTQEWFEARKLIVNGSKAATAIGWHGQKDQDKYWDLLSSNLNGDKFKVETTDEMAMKWGKMCEKHGMATYLKHYINKEPDLLLYETGLWKHQDWLGSSPDGIIKGDNGNICLEVKCPYRFGQPAVFNKLPVYYIPQVQLEMFVTKTKICHLVCWTPTETKIFKIKRDDEFIIYLTEYLKDFYNSAKHKSKTMWTTGKQNRSALKKQAKQISEDSPCFIQCKPLIDSSANEDSDMVYFTKQTKNLFYKDVKKIRLCSKCGKSEWYCKIKPCEGRTYKHEEKRNKKSDFTSYTYGSNNVPNSCHQDTFLECFHQLYSPLPNPTSEIGILLNSSYLKWEEGLYHDSKMLLWTYLQNKTAQGHTYFKLGKQASLASIFERVYENMNETERENYFIKCNRTQTCLSAGHMRQRVVHEKIRNINFTDLKVADLNRKNKFDICKYIEEVYTANQDHNTNLYCHIEGCKSTCLHDNSSINIPNCFAVQIENKNEKIKASIQKTHIQLAAGYYELKGIIFYGNQHFWMKVNINKKNLKTGWYHYDGMNHGNASFCGKKLNLSKTDEQNLHILVFKKAHIVTIMPKIVKKEIDLLFNNMDITSEHKDVKKSHVTDEDWQNEHNYNSSKRKRENNSPNLNIPKKMSSTRLKRKNPKYSDWE